MKTWLTVFIEDYDAVGQPKLHPLFSALNDNFHWLALGGFSSVQSLAYGAVDRVVHASLHAAR
jgi:hypothetical protein